MEPKTCWCCGKPLDGYPERFDGVCPECGIEDTPNIEITTEGRLVADEVRHMDYLVLQAILKAGREPEPETWPEQVW